MSSTSRDFFLGSLVVQPSFSEGQQQETALYAAQLTKVAVQFIAKY